MVLHNYRENKNPAHWVGLGRIVFTDESVSYFKADSMVLKSTAPANILPFTT